MGIPTISLNDGKKIPVVGFGIGTAFYGKEAKEAVLQALDAGYVSLDMAQGYANNQSAGNALNEFKGDRSSIYLLTKWSAAKSEDPNEARTVLEALLKELGTDHVDMYLIHSPMVSKAPHAKQWAVMEQIQKDGLAKSIGISNWREEDIAGIADSWTIPPAVNQIEFNPYLWHAPYMKRLAAIMKKHDIKMQAYGPLSPLVHAPGGPVDAVVEKIAAAKNATPAQVLLQWAAQFGGGTVVTTSRTPSRQQEQLAAFSLAPLSEAEVEEIAHAGKGKFFRKYMKEVWDQAKE